MVWALHMEKMDDEKVSLKTEKFVVDGFMSDLRRDGLRISKKDILDRKLKRTDAKTALCLNLAAKLAHLCSGRKQAKFHEVKNICQYLLILQEQANYKNFLAFCIKTAFN